MSLVWVFWWSQAQDTEVYSYIIRELKQYKMFNYMHCWYIYIVNKMVKYSSIGNGYHFFKLQNWKVTTIYRYFITVKKENGKYRFQFNAVFSSLLYEVSVFMVAD